MVYLMENVLKMNDLGVATLGTSGILGSCRCGFRETDHVDQRLGFDQVRIWI
jgi:hypothetical protein